MQASVDSMMRLQLAYALNEPRVIVIEQNIWEPILQNMFECQVETSSETYVGSG